MQHKHKTASRIKHKTASRKQSEEVVFFPLPTTFHEEFELLIISDNRTAFSYQAKDIISVKEMISCKLFYFGATIHTAA